MIEPMIAQLRGAERTHPETVVEIPPEKGREVRVGGLRPDGRGQRDRDQTDQTQGDSQNRFHVIGAGSLSKQGHGMKPLLRCGWRLAGSPPFPVGPSSRARAVVAVSLRCPTVPSLKECGEHQFTATP
jgi:hypothetical protein